MFTAPVSALTFDAQHREEEEGGEGEEEVEVEVEERRQEQVHPPKRRATTGNRPVAVAAVHYGGMEARRATGRGEKWGGARGA